MCDEIVSLSGEKICPECLNKLHFVKEPVCLKCGKEIESERQEYCADCMHWNKAFEAGMALVNYEETARRSMAGIKYKNKREYLDFYADEMVRHYTDKIRHICPDMLVPVPIHPRRRWERGFNQAEVLAHKLAKEWKIPVCVDLLIRRKQTEPQKNLSPAERRKNLKGAFESVKRADGAECAVLVDDIYTTGATAQACTLALKEAGIKKVYVLTICIGSGWG